MTNTNQVLLDIEAAIQGVETVLPSVLAVVGAFYAPAKAVVPFLPFLQVALNAVQEAEAVLNGDTAGAVASVTNKLQTPTPVPAQPAS